MTKEELVAAVIKDCKKDSLSIRRTHKILDTIFASMAQGIKKGAAPPIPVLNVSFKKRKSPKRGESSNGEEILIKAGETVKFKPFQGFKKFLG